MSIVPLADELIRRILIQASDDWISYAELRGLVDEYSAENGRTVTSAEFLCMIESLLESGFLVAGDVAPQSGFGAWSGNVGAQVARIMQVSGGRAEFAPGDVCWFDLSIKGNQVLRQLQTPGP